MEQQPNVATIKIDQEDLNVLKKIQEDTDMLIKEFGQIKLSEISLQQRTERAEKFLEQLKLREKDAAEKLEAKYGKGSLNVDTGELIPFK